MNRAIIVRGQSGSGKSTVLMRIHQWIASTYSPSLLYSLPMPSADVYEIFTVGALTIGFCSAGDEGPGVQDFLNDCIARNCDLIIGACRGKGATRQAVISTLTKPGFVISWTDTYHVHPPLITAFNNDCYQEVKALLIGLS